MTNQYFNTDNYTLNALFKEKKKPKSVDYVVLLHFFSFIFSECQIVK